MSERRASARVPLTIVVGTIQGWPEIAPNVASLRAAAEAAGGELIVADGSGLPAPSAADIGRVTRWISRPGASVFQLRQVGYAEARGEVVAITEDHCFVPREWGRHFLDTHARHPEAAAVGGSVENAATRHLIDWASFFVVQAAFMAPLPTGPAERVAGAVNVAYKRRALDSLRVYDGMGAMDILHQRMLRERGEALWVEDAIRVWHDQSLGVRATTVIHFHAGRTMSGFNRQRMNAYHWARAAGAFVVPLARLGRILAIGTRKGHGPRLAVSLPWIVWLLYSQAAGQFIGYALGPGESPRLVQ
jgi:hypothetical protein